jgi:WhiB family redox-sensing transcriptional regulator
MSLRPTRHTTPETERAHSWRDDAECLREDPELFFPAGEQRRVDKDQIRKAKLVCQMCDVATQCLKYALETNAQVGIYGGFTPKERQRLNRNMSQWALGKAIELSRSRVS